MAWWLLSIFALAGLAFGIWRSLDPAAWRGRPGPHGPTQLWMHKGRLQRVRAGVPTACRLPFEFKAETRFDRLAKWMRLSVEGQVGDDVFDRQFYLLSDDPVVLGWLRADPRLCRALLALGSAQVPPPFRFRRLTCAGGLVYADYVAQGRDADAAKLIGGLQLRLQDLARALPATAPPVHNLDPAARRARPFIVASVALFLHGVAQFFWEVYKPLPRVLDTGEMWLAAAIVAATALALGLLFAWTRLGRTARTHIVLVGMLVFGVPGMWLSSMALVREVNLLVDLRPPQTLSVDVLEQRVSHSRRGPDRHRLKVQFDSDDARLRRARWLTVSRADFAGAGLATPRRAIVHQGLLGMYWIEGFERVEPALR